MYYSKDDDKKVERLLVKYHGIRFSFNIQGYGGKWDIRAFSNTLGSGIALTAIAAAVTEILLRHCISERAFYTKKRRELVKIEEKVA